MITIQCDWCEELFEGDIRIIEDDEKLVMTMGFHLFESGAVCDDCMEDQE